ncbi:hypothetical protein DL770_001056 [Monosporascus sp. CRB-9-2]|nr:hypothetical protein DL770_001056 [Monosporascus sp. CRB-9-2]
MFSALGSIEASVGDPSTRLLDFSMRYLESKALQIAVQHRLADMLQQHDSEGLHVAQTAQRIGAEEDKLVPFTSADYLPDMLVHPKMVPSYELNETALSLALGTDQSGWDWVSNKVPASQLRSYKFEYIRDQQSSGH